MPDVPAPPTPRGEGLAATLRHKVAGIPVWVLGAVGVAGGAYYIYRKRTTTAQTSTAASQPAGSQATPDLSTMSGLPPDYFLSSATPTSSPVPASGPQAAGPPALLTAYNFSAQGQAVSANGQIIDPSTGTIFGPDGSVTGQAKPGPNGMYYIPGPGPGGYVGTAIPDPSGSGIYETFLASGQRAGEWVPLGTPPPPEWQGAGSPATGPGGAAYWVIGRQVPASS